MAPNENFEATPALLPWERFGWSPEQKQRIYRDWGLYGIQKKEQKLAESCYDKCLEIDPNDSKALYMRSYCKRFVARTESALEDALAAEKIDSYNPSISIAICDALYELNEFEKCKAEWHNNTTKYGSAIVKRFINRLVVVDENLSNCLGDSLGLFILKNEKYFPTVFEAIKRKEIINDHPLWKILQEQEKCDVLSIPDEEDEKLSPLNLARRERWFRIFNQIYFRRNWRDVVFMRDLIKRDDWVFPQFIVSKPILRNLLVPNYGVVKKFVKMLHVRSPLYDKYARKFGNEKLLKKNREDYLNCMQYRTRRNMIIALRNIRYYRQKGQVERMTKYVEAIMGNYVVLKTSRIMPWKFEFVNEVYNMLALARADKLVIPDEFRYKKSSRKSLTVLLQIPADSADHADTFVFGKKSSSLDDQAAADKHKKYINYLMRLEKRKRFAKYSIEMCYLWHETARTHLRNSKHEKCVSAAKKALEETRNCNSILWAFLSMMLIVKAHAALHKIEYCKDALADAYILAKMLRNPRIVEFVELCDVLNENFMEIKRKTQSMESIRKRKTGSTSTRNSIADSDGETRLDKHKSHYDFAVCEVLNRLKQFERCKAELHNNTRKYYGANAKKFRYDLDVIDENLKDCLGASFESFMRKIEKYFSKVLEAIKREESYDPRPRWKILKEQDKCDVLSVDEKEYIVLSYLEKARRERWYHIFNQIYFGRNWVDKVFLRDLSKNKNNLLPYFMESTPLLKEFLEPQHEAVKKFVKILHARSPLYCEQYKRFGNQKFARRHTEGYLFGQQYQARRKMFNVLRTIQEFRKAGNVEDMSRYIEDVMGDYVTTKTNRIMPRKFEFKNEVYNTLALTHADKYFISSDKRQSKDSSKYRLHRMLGLPIEEKVKSSGFVFGDRSTYFPADTVDPNIIKYKNFLARMEKRLVFAKYSIEKAYLWHEIARAHFKNNRYEECNNAAIRAIEASKACNSILWSFLSQMLIVKSYALQHKVEYCQDSLNEAVELARLLKNSNLINFVELAMGINNEEIVQKQSITSMEFSRRKWYGSAASQLTSASRSRERVSTISNPTYSEENLEEESANV